MPWWSIVYLGYKPSYWFTSSKQRSSLLMRTVRHRPWCSWTCRKGCWALGRAQRAEPGCLVCSVKVSLGACPLLAASSSGLAVISSKWEGKYCFFVLWVSLDVFLQLLDTILLNILYIVYIIASIMHLKTVQSCFSNVGQPSSIEVLHNIQKLYRILAEDFCVSGVCVVS